MENPFQIIIDKLGELDRKVSSSISFINGNLIKEPADKADDVLDFEGFCNFLKISKASGYKYTSTNTVPFYKKNGKLYFLKSDLIEWIRSGKVKTRWELDEAAERFVNSRTKKF